MVSESQIRGGDRLADPDYTLIVRVEDLEGVSENALSGITSVKVVVEQNLWVNPGPLTVREHLKTQYPMVIAKVGAGRVLGGCWVGGGGSPTRFKLSVGIWATFNISIILLILLRMLEPFWSISCLFLVQYSGAVTHY